MITESICEWLLSHSSVIENTEVTLNDFCRVDSVTLTADTTREINNNDNNDIDKMMMQK
ncbi:6125_t:CDS:2 [Funneliformis geosporum]|uniref:6125_t:CDS:1 n=1 Tax=Funneliformis geosporum TaxID=1117311 RepID=A0A9W4WN64_9GLOM|nr:6125_t:CDS:2 [Funneliformis geosporum]